MKKSAYLLFLLCLVSFPGYCQIEVGYNTDGNTLALSTNSLNKLWGEIRVNTKYYNQASWTYSDRGITQTYFMVNVFNKSNSSLYVGIGAGMNLLSKESDKWFSINIPVGIKISLFKTLPDLAIIGEYNPMFIIQEGVPAVQSVSLGFRYRIIKEE